MPDPISANPAASSLVRFNELRLAAYELLLLASRLPSLPALQARQAEASAGLAGIRLHRVYGQGTADDALAIRGDIETIARKVDPLIAAIGDAAAEEFHNIDQSQFGDALTNAIGDGAGPQLTAASERAADDRDDAEFDARHPGTHRAAMAREA